jgi:hypothetical protein
VQGPDGNELTVNGQKGIQNNVSVDGADYNNPFFGEQRGGQRPAFTFNLDAVQEMVVVADGANAEFGRSSSGFVNVVTKSGTNDFHGTVHGFYKSDSTSSAPQRADGTTAPKTSFEQEQAGATLGGPLVKDRVFFFTAFDYQRNPSTKQVDPARIEQRVVDALAALGSPNENGPIQRSNDAKVFLAKFDAGFSDKHQLSLKYNGTSADQNNGTFDVDSWGRSANADEQDSSKAGSGSLVSAFSASLVNEARFQWAREDRPRPYNGPNITGQNRPLPDTAFDFGKSYRFGEPFFIPVDYHDTRVQFVDNATVLRGAHTIKAGVEVNRVDSFQTFRGFGNGRFIFDSTDGFLNYVKNPKYVECSDGSSSQAGVCPAGTSITGPVLLFLQQVGVGGRTVDQAGTQDIEQWEPAVFIQDKWQPTSSLTVQFGLRWEGLIEPPASTPPSQVFYSAFIGKTVNGQTFSSDGTIPNDMTQFQPRLGITWDPKGDGKSVARASAGLFDSRVPGLVLASSRSTNGSIGQSLFRSSAASPFLGPVPAYTSLIPASSVGNPDHPDVYVVDKNFQNPRTFAASVSYETEVVKDLAVSLKYNYADTKHLTRFINGNDPLLGSPWSTGLGADGKNGIGTLWVVQSSAHSTYNGFTLGVTKRLSNNFQFQGTYTLSWDKSNDDNERDPFTLRYAKITNLDAEWGYSDRDQRHRVGLWALWNAPLGLQLNGSFQYRSAQPQSLTATGAVANSPQDRCSAVNPDGSCTANSVVTERNLGRKDNQYASLNLRLSRPFSAGAATIEPMVEVFNLFNRTNLLNPGTTNLIFNFDGTVQAGLGEARQVQFGLRVAF